MTAADDLLSTFRDEAAERLAEAENGLLALARNPHDREELDRTFRALHTVKGASAMVGLETISRQAHELEALFERVRAGQLTPSREVVDLALQGVDILRSLVARPSDEKEAERRAFGVALASLGPSGSRAPASAPIETFRIRFRPARELFQNGTNPALLLAELEAMGDCQIVAETSAIPALEMLEPEACYVSWEILLSTSRGKNAILDVFVFVEGRSELKVEALAMSEDAPKKLGEILVERGDLTPGQLAEALASQRRVGDILREKGYVTAASVEAAALEQKVRHAQAGLRAPEATSQPSVRVAAERLDELVDLVGELVIAQARLLQIAGRREDAELSAVAEDLARLSADLRDHTLGIRMVPIGTTFNRFERLVHDLSGELGKDIALVTEGAETELDKTVIERLGDPLIHVIRNSCDHGIETPAVRLAAGKTARAEVKLSAHHAGRYVIVQICDDGAGLDHAAIRARAEEKGLVERGATLTEAEIAALIFLPGFSTAKSVSAVSGRGVGMDVVKRSIDALRGTVEVTSQRGRGTCVRITLPLTLAIIEGLLVSVGAAKYVLPMSLVEECVELTRDDVARAHGNQVTPVRGELVPYLRLREWFEVAGDGPAIEQITIVTAGGLRCGLVVDHVIGQHQTVIKSLGHIYGGVKGISGATILGDGSVALIIDVPVLLRAATEHLEERSVQREWS